MKKSLLAEPRGEQDLGDELSVGVASQTQKQEEFALVCLARGGDTKAETALIQRHSKMVRTAASRLRAKGVCDSFQFEDLIQEGNIGLLDAMKRYELNEGSSFGTFAFQRVFGSMVDALRNNSGRSRRLSDYLRKAEKVKTALSHELLREPTLWEWREALPENLRVNFEELRGEANTSRVVSLFSVNNEGEEVFLGDAASCCENEKSAEDEVVRRQEDDMAENSNRVLRQVMEKILDWSECEVVYWRYLVSSENVSDLAKIAEKLGVVESRVSQIETEALDKLRRYLRTCYPQEVTMVKERLSQV